MATISRLSVALTANTRRFSKGIGLAKNTLSSLVGSIFNVKTAVAGLIGGVGLGLLVRNVIQVNAKFQTLKSSLKTVTGGTKQAAKAFKLIEKFAATTPFNLDQVVEGFIKLKALGLDPSEEALRSYGNTASAMGKSLNQMIEAVADASTGEFERLKEFGIKARNEGDTIAFTFQGVTTRVKNNAEAIEGYLKSIGDVQFGTAMKDQMENLDPAFSNLQTAWDGIKRTIGESGLNALVTSLTTSFTDFLLSIKPETIKEWTRFVIDAGFALADLVLDGVAWLAQLGDGVQSLEIIWLKLQQGVIGFGKSVVGVASTVTAAIDSMLGRTTEQKLANMNSQIEKLQERIATRQAGNVFGGETGILGGLLDYDPAKTRQMIEDVEILKAKALALQTGLVKGEKGLLSDELQASRDFLASLDTKVGSKLASAIRIANAEGGLDWEAKIQQGVIGAKDFLDEQQKIARGEDLEGKDFIAGIDPLLERQLVALEGIQDNTANLSGAVAQ
jgi:hypothetical protein